MMHQRNSKLFIIAIIVFGTVCSCRFYFDTTKENFTIDKSKISMMHGKNLAFNICGGCHYDSSAKKFIGRYLNDLPKIAGTLYSANLTQSLTHGIMPMYSDAEVFYLLKTGIARDGHFAPYMMRPTLADEDINDIIAFFRSDDPSVSPADTTAGHTHINLIGRMGIRFVTKPRAYKKGLQRPLEDDPVVYGRYLVANIGCYHCHSRKVLALNYDQPDKTKGYLQGGIKLKDPKGKRLFGPNLTPDKETGIGNFSREDFKKAVVDGISPSGKKLSPPMDHFTHLTEQQITAIYTYLKSLPPVHHQIKKSA